MSLETTSMKSRLSPEAKKEITTFSGSMPAIFIGQAVMAWVIILVSIYIANTSDSILVKVLCVIVIATRQNILGLLTHEQAHYLGLHSKYGDWICNAFISYPLLIMSVENYAKVHLAHHRNFFTPNDPDFIRKSGEDWELPLPPKKLAHLFLKDLLGLSAVAFMRGKNAEVSNYSFRRKFPTPSWFKVAYFLTLAIILTVTGAWPAFLLYWVLPLVTVLQAIIRWGALCEHVYSGVEGASVESCSPVILNRWWEKILLPNLNFTLHTYHHYFPGVSFSKLPRVHALFTKEGLVNNKLIFHGYGHYLKFLAKSPVAE